jgi:hypothetical protein
MPKPSPSVIRADPATRRSSSTLGGLSSSTRQHAAAQPASARACRLKNSILPASERTRRTAPPGAQQQQAHARVWGEVCSRGTERSPVPSRGRCHAAARGAGRQAVPPQYLPDLTSCPLTSSIRVPSRPCRLPSPPLTAAASCLRRSLSAASCDINYPVFFILISIRSSYLFSSF